jgi:hypothetical protein
MGCAFLQAFGDHVFHGKRANFPVVSKVGADHILKSGRIRTQRN